ncbi:MAG: hypothetical protein IJY08_03230 [Clostridia bacterium]|nr:hypothetical protein [Clostridia bacterium]
MKKFLRLFTALILVISMLTVAIPGIVAMAAESSSDTLFSQSDLAAANTAGTLSTLVTAFTDTNVAYDTANEMLTFGRTNGWCTMRLDLTGSSIDTTQDNWLSGKTLEFELVLVDASSGNPTIDFSPYPETRDANFVANNNKNEWGPTLWWYAKNRSLALVNENGVAQTLNHTKAERIAPEMAAGDSVKFRIIQTTDKIVVCYYDTEAEKWVAIDDGIAVNELTFTYGGLYFNARGKDTWGIKGLSITNSASISDVHFGELSAGGSSEEIEREPTYETDSKYIISQETFRKAKNVASFFPAVGTAMAGITSWQGGLNSTAVTYDKEKDMVLFDTSKNTNIQGNTLYIPEFDTTKENAFQGYTVEYELVLVDINSTNPMSKIGFYFDNFTKIDTGCGIWWYQKSGNLTQGNAQDGFAHIYDIIGFKKAEGESVKFKIVCDEFGITSFYDYGEGWQIMGITETEELFYNKGDMYFAFRNGDVYGIKNFAMYANEESGEQPDDDKPGDDQPEDTGDTSVDTSATDTSASDTSGAATDTTAAGTTAVDTTDTSEDKGCGSALSLSAFAIVAIAVPCFAFCGRKKEK